MKNQSSAVPDRQTLQRQYRAQHAAYTGVLLALQQELTGIFEPSGINTTIKARVKSFDSYYAKLLRLLKKHPDRSDACCIYDVLGLRVICPFADDLKKVEDSIKRRFDVLEVDYKSKKRAVDEFGYDAVHVLIRLPPRLVQAHGAGGQTVCEIQLRTILQEAWSEVEHELVYKADFSLFDEPLKRKLAALKATLTLSDTLFQEIRDHQRLLLAEIRKRQKTFLNCMHSSAPKLPVKRPGAKKTPRPAARRAGKAEAASINELLLEALDAHNAGNYPQAIKAYTCALSRDLPGHIKAILSIHCGMAHFAASDHRAALEEFTRAAELDPHNLKALYYRSLTYQRMGEDLRALEDSNRCLAIDPFQPDVLHMRAQIFFRLCRFQEALRDCEQVLHLHPDNAGVQKLKRKLLRY